jgi:hypothetical protein
MPWIPRPFDYYGTSPNQILEDLTQANDNFEILGKCFVNDDPTTGKAKIAEKADNADTVDGFHASQTPSPNTIPVADSTGKIDTGWLNLNISQTPTPNAIPQANVNGKINTGWFPSRKLTIVSYSYFSPSANTIYQEIYDTIIMVVSQDLYGLRISPNGSNWYGIFGQEHYYSAVEGGTITFFVPADWFWVFSNLGDSTNSNFSNFVWFKIQFQIV